MLQSAKPQEEDWRLTYLKYWVKRKKKTRKGAVLSLRGKADTQLLPLVPFGNSAQLDGPDTIFYGWMENTMSSFIVENLRNMLSEVGPLFHRN